jgi:hypothetical protein
MNSDTSTAYQAGQMVGMIVIGLLSLGTLVFFIVALVKAFTRKTTGWIITAVAMGLMGAAMAVVMASSLVMFIARKASENGEMTKVLKARDNKYQVTVPTSWKQMPDLNPQAEIVAGNVFNEQYLMVLIEEKSELKMDLAAYMTSTSDRMESILEGGKQGAPTTLSISGHPAMRRTITGKTESVNIAYLHTCVETGEHLVQIICWTLSGRQAKAFPTFEQVAATFAENRASEPAKTAARPPADR